jgi:hypothetical protein
MLNLENLSFGQGNNNNYYCPMWQPSSGDAATDSLLGGKKTDSLKYLFIYLFIFKFLISLFRSR